MLVWEANDFVFHHEFVQFPSLFHLDSYWIQLDDDYETYFYQRGRERERESSRKKITEIEIQFSCLSSDFLVYSIFIRIFFVYFFFYSFVKWIESARLVTNSQIHKFSHLNVILSFTQIAKILCSIELFRK